MTFIKYVHEHLLAKARDVVRLRRYVCPHCETGVDNLETARRRLEQGRKDILCVNCEGRVPLRDLIEEKFASEEFQQRVRELEQKARAAIDSESKELILVGETYSIAGFAGQIYRQYANSDHGIDGEIEFRDNEGNASGKRLYLQLKFGDSYLRTRQSDGTEVFQIKNPRWAEYWQQQAYPVMLLVRRSGGPVRWMNVSAHLERVSEGGKKVVKHILFEAEPFNASSILKRRDEMLGPPPIPE